MFSIKNILPTHGHIAIFPILTMQEATTHYARLEGDGVYNLTGYYPQAGRHFLLGMTVRF